MLLSQSRSGWADWALLFALVAVWGSAFAGLKIAAQEIAPAWIVASRLTIGSALLLVCVRLAGERLPPLSDPAWCAYAWIGALGTAAPFFLFAWAAGHMDSVIVAICNGASPFFTAALTALMLSERLGARKIVGLALGISGLAALAAQDAQAGLGSAHTLGIMAGLAGAAGYAYANVAAQAAPPVGPVSAAAMFSIAGAILSLPLALATAPLPVDASLPALASVTALGVGPSGLASIGYIVLTRRRGPLFTAYSTYLMPIWAAFVGILFLGERPGWIAALALALVLAGLAVSSSGLRAVRTSE
jgi:drug/metabolite transporter (DMT)-like permease